MILWLWNLCKYISQGFIAGGWLMMKGILFDKDGTLLEYNATMHHIYTNVFRYLEERYRVPGVLLQQLKDGLGHLQDRLGSDSLLQFSTNPQIVDALLEYSREFTVKHQWRQPYGRNELLDLIEELSTGDDVPYVTLPEVPETLEYLKLKGYRLGIATADTHAATVAGLEKTAIQHYFDYLGTSDETPPKPEPFQAEMFCRQFGLSAHEIVMVGDSRNDMLFAENAGTHFVGIAAAGDASSGFMGTAHKAVVNINEIINLFGL